MTSSAGGAARLGRATGLTAVAVSLAALAHVVAGGRAPSVAALALAALPLALVTAAPGRPRCWRAAGGRWTTVGGLVLTQVLLHLWFSATGGPGCTLTAADLPRRATAALAALTSSLPFGFAPAPAAGCVPDVTTADLRGTALTMLCHLTAVVLTGLAVAHGEAALWRLVDRVRPTHPVLCRPAPAPARAGDHRPRREGADPLLNALRRRGPPPATAAA